MERMTVYTQIAGVKTGDLKTQYSELEAYHRLAAYEDTGLEPDEIAHIRAELAWEREREERKPDEWERMINAYGELEGFMHTKCGHQSQSATHYCSNCGRKMAISESEAALGKGDAE